MIAHAPIDVQTQEKIHETLVRAAVASGIDPEQISAVYSASKLKDDWFFLPLDVRIKNAWDKATAIQALEDAWNDDPQQRKLFRLSLVPVGVPIDLD